MPTIRVDGPPIPDIDKKRELVKRLTATAVDIYGIEHILVIIRETAPENVGINGELIADLHNK